MLAVCIAFLCALLLAALTYLGLLDWALAALSGVVGCCAGLGIGLHQRRKGTRQTPPPAPLPALGLLESTAEELKKALHTISGFSEVLLARPAREDAEWRQPSMLLMETTRQISLFAAQLHDYARFERGALRLHEQQVDAAELVTAALHLCEDRAERADIYIKADLSHSAELACDAVRIRQAITSLILWMVEASPPGSVIDVTLLRTAAGGIAFRAFNQLAANPKGGAADPFEPQLPLAGLTGLALPIARRVTLLHCGGVRVETAQGAGISTCLFLPAQRVAWPEAAANTPPRAA